jgi:hypothetical protein
VALTANAKGLLTAVSSFLCRELLTADRTYYVRTDGNDSNTGSANTAGGAFLTLQKAANVILRTIDTNGFNVTIDVTGALMAGASFSGPVIGGGTVTITSTAGASITVTGGHCITASQGCRITVNGSLTFSTVTSGVCLLAYAGGYISTSGGTFGPAATGHMQAGWTAPSGLDSGGGTIDITGNYSISAGTSGSHLHATTEGAYIHYVLSTITVTLTGTPAFSNFFAGVTKGFIYAVGVTWSGAATGQRYTVHNGGAIFGPASRTALPGSTAGVVAAGGLYITDDNNNDFGANNVLASGAVTTSSPTSGIGYAAGAGGIVTQLTSKSTAVTLNTVSGQITMNAASLASGGNVTFTLNNSNIAATDVVLVCIKGGATANSYLLTVSAIAAGSVNIDLRSYNAGALAEALVLNFVVVKAVNA